MRLHDYAASANCFKVRLLVAQLVIERQRAVPFVTGDSLEAQTRKLHHLPGERQTFLRGVHSAAVHAGVDLNHDPQR